VSCSDCLPCHRSLQEANWACASRVQNIWHSLPHLHPPLCQARSAWNFLPNRAKGLQPAKTVAAGVVDCSCAIESQKRSVELATAGACCFVVSSQHFVVAGTGKAPQLAWLGRFVNTCENLRENLTDVSFFHSRVKDIGNVASTWRSWGEHHFSSRTAVATLAVLQAPLIDAHSSSPASSSSMHNHQNWDHSQERKQHSQIHL
jgi:hypothetical protein